MLLNQDGFCCRGLERAFEERRDRGIFVFAEAPVDERGPSFWLGMRSVGLDDVAAFKCDSPIALTLATWRPIRHCPWCGCRLARRYAKTYTALLDADLAREHALPTSDAEQTSDNDE